MEEIRLTWDLESPVNNRGKVPTSTGLPDFFHQQQCKFQSINPWGDIMSRWLVVFYLRNLPLEKDIPLEVQRSPRGPWLSWAFRPPKARFLENCSDIVDPEKFRELSGDLFFSTRQRKSSDLFHCLVWNRAGGLRPNQMQSYPFWSFQKNNHPSNPHVYLGSNSEVSRYAWWEDQLCSSRFFGTQATIGWAYEESSYGSIER